MTATASTPAAPRPGARPRLATLFRPNEVEFVDAGASGEFVVGQIRFLLTLLLLCIPAVQFLAGAEGAEATIGLVLALGAFAFAGLVLTVLRRGGYRPGMGVWTSIVDVSLVSAGLAVFLVRGEPLTAVNSKVVFEVYFLAIGATSLRYDPRICIVAGTCAVFEYALIVMVASARWDLAGPEFAGDPYGVFNWAAQASRMLLLATATVLATAVVNRARALRRMSSTDRLTGLYNRAYGEDRLDAELARAERNRTPLSVVLLDVDRFKDYNDHHGHAAGDAALKTLAERLRQALRRTDIVARYGGEEFLILLPDTPQESAIEKLEALRESIAFTPVPLPRTSSVANLTISAGIATAPDDGTDAESLVAAADARLFRAKAEGRNKVVGHSPL